MAKQNTAGGQADSQGKEQFEDILLLLDKASKDLKAVTGLDENGKAQTIPYDETKNNSFLKVDKWSSIVENFWKNLVDQFKDPTKFNLLSVKESELDKEKIKKALKDLAAGKETKAVKDFLEKYDISVKTPEVAKAKEIDWAALEKATGIPREMLEKSGMASAMTKMAAGEEVKIQERAPQAHRYSDSLVPWEQLTAMGVPKETLVQKGFLDEMLKGRKTSDLVPMTLDLGYARIRLEARLSLMPGENGLKMYMNSVRQKPDLDRAFMGHIFSDTDKKNLLNENGNLGRVVPLMWRDGEHDSFISIDKLTNDIVALRADQAYIPEIVSGVKLSEYELSDLKEGKPVRVEGLVSSNGREFNATLQVNADRRGVEYIFDNQKLFNAQTIAGVKITDKMREEVNAGKAIKLENMQGKNGEYYDRFIKLDPATGNLSYTKYNPDSPEDNREIIIPKELGGVKIPEAEQQQMREGKPVWMPDMTMRNGEERSMWVRADLKTGELQFASDPTKFEERKAITVPQDIMGASLSGPQRAQLQDGKAVLVDGIKGHDGKTLSQWVRMNQNTGKPEMYNENPDRKRDASQRNILANRQKPSQGKDNANKKGRGMN